MDLNQQSTILRAIAVSSLHLPQFTASDRQAAFAILQDLKVYDGRIPLCISWLHQATHVYEEQSSQGGRKVRVKVVLLTILRRRRNYWRSKSQAFLTGLRTIQNRID
jgi:hypothetical protein